MNRREFLTVALSTPLAMGAILPSDKVKPIKRVEITAFKILSKKIPHTKRYDSLESFNKDRGNALITPLFKMDILSEEIFRIKTEPCKVNTFYILIDDNPYYNLVEIICSTPEEFNLRYKYFSNLSEEKVIL